MAEVARIRTARMKRMVAEVAGGRFESAPVYVGLDVDRAAVKTRWMRMDFSRRFEDAFAQAVADGEREGWSKSVPFIDFEAIERARAELGDESAEAMASAISADPM